MSKKTNVYKNYLLLENFWLRKEPKKSNCGLSVCLSALCSTGTTAVFWLAYLRKFGSDISHWLKLPLLWSAACNTNTTPDFSILFSDTVSILINWIAWTSQWIIWPNNILYKENLRWPQIGKRDRIYLSYAGIILYTILKLEIIERKSSKIYIFLKNLLHTSSHKNILYLLKKVSWFKISALATKTLTSAFWQI